MTKSQNYFDGRVVVFEMESKKLQPYLNGKTGYLRSSGKKIQSNPKYPLTVESTKTQSTAPESIDNSYHFWMYYIESSTSKGYILTNSRGKLISYYKGFLVERGWHKGFSIEREDDEHESIMFDIDDNGFLIRKYGKNKCSVNISGFPFCLTVGIGKGEPLKVKTAYSFKELMNLKPLSNIKPVPDIPNLSVIETTSEEVLECPEESDHIPVARYFIPFFLVLNQFNRGVNPEQLQTDTPYYTLDVMRGWARKESIIASKANKSTSVTISYSTQEQVSNFEFFINLKARLNIDLEKLVSQSVSQFGFCDDVASLTADIEGKIQNHSQSESTSITMFFDPKYSVAYWDQSYKYRLSDETNKEYISQSDLCLKFTTGKKEIRAQVYNDKGKKL